MRISSLTLWMSLLALALFQCIQLYNLEVTTFAVIKEVYTPPQPQVVSSLPSEAVVASLPQEKDRQKSAEAVVALPAEQKQKSASFTWNSNNTCQIWPAQNYRNPSGLVVTLILTPDEERLKKSIKILCCQSVSSQLIHLLGPQKWDLLLLTAGDHFRSTLSNEYIQECLNLTSTQEESKLWLNLDGSNLTTTRYLWHDSVSVYLSHIHLEFPKYIQEDPSLLNLTIEPPVCNAPKSYIQGTRWYADQMLHLAILQEYNWFIKLDLDLFFGKTVEWDLLHDLQQKQSVFGHTGEMAEWAGRSCTKGIVQAMRDFQAQKQQSSIDYCASDHKLLQVDRDFYYTNFIMGRVDFWTQPLVLELARFLTEYQPGYFHARWTDQVFWGQAMGLLRGLDNVVDYAELRCSVEKNCWRAVFYYGIYGNDSHSKCDNDGYFRHNKNHNLKWNPIPTYTGDLWWSDSEVYETKYKDECKERVTKKQKEVREKEFKEKEQLALVVK